MWAASNTKHEIQIQFRETNAKNVFFFLSSDNNMDRVTDGLSRVHAEAHGRRLQNVSVVVRTDFSASTSAYYCSKDQPTHNESNLESAPHANIQSDLLRTSTARSIWVQLQFAQG